MADDQEQTAVVEELLADESKVAPMLEKLAALVKDEDLDVEEVRHVAEDPYFARRCLIACLNDANKAYKMAAKGLRWRSQVKPSRITPDDFATAGAQGVLSLATHAKNGWPVVYCYAVKWNPWRYGTAEYGRMMAYLMEAVEAAMDPNDPYARMYFVFDMKHMNRLNSDLRKIAELTRFAATYYPERIVAVTVNADLVTFALWRFIRPLIDTRTADRVTLLRGNGLDVLDGFIGLDEVPPSVGGTRTEEWPPLSAESRAHFRWGVDATGAPHNAVQERESRVSEKMMIEVDEPLPTPVAVQG